MFLMIYCAINPWCTDSLIVIRSCNGKFSQPFNLTCWVSVNQWGCITFFQMLEGLFVPRLHVNDLVCIFHKYIVCIFPITSLIKLCIPVKSPVVGLKLVVQLSPCKNESFTHKLKSSFLRNIGLMLH